MHGFVLLLKKKCRTMKEGAESLDGWGLLVYTVNEMEINPFFLPLSHLWWLVALFNLPHNK